MSPLARLEGVTAGYTPQAPVLEGVSFAVQPGELWGVLGPNGAGKSSLVRVLLGLLTPSQGRVTVGAHTLPASPEQLARQVAWVPQAVNEETAFTALELTLMGRTPRLGGWGLPGAHDVALARALLEELDLHALVDRPLNQCSGGERRRVWLARALAQQAPLLILDEPTAFLDVRHQVQTLQVVRRRLGPDFGAVAVLHDVNLVAHAATHVVLLKGGRVQAQGPTAQVLTAAALSALYDIEMREVTPGVFVPAWSADA
jgi:iron complex transport system ATP-binding protein